MEKVPCKVLERFLEYGPANISLHIKIYQKIREIKNWKKIREIEIFFTNLKQQTKNLEDIGMEFLDIFR